MVTRGPFERHDAGSWRHFFPREVSGQVRTPAVILHAVLDLHTFCGCAAANGLPRVQLGDTYSEQLSWLDCIWPSSRLRGIFLEKLMLNVFSESPLALSYQWSKL